MGNEVETRHPEYLHREYEWRQLRDTNSGTSNIKRSGELYLPIPAAMLDIEKSASVSSDSGHTNTGDLKSASLRQNAPWYHPIAAYSAYLQRAKFPDIVASCLRGFVGIVIKKEPEIKLPKSLEYLIENVDGNGTSISQLFKQIISELLLVGKYVLVVDVDEKSVFKTVSYNAESFINWEISRRLNNELAIEQLDFAVFEECVKSSKHEMFSHDTKNIQRVLVLINGQFESILYDDGKFDESTRKPFLFRGKPLDFIPILCANSNKVTFETGSSPLLGISDIAISIYQKDADLSQSEFLTCNPMLVITGSDPEDVPASVGSSVAWCLPDSDSKAMYVEPSGSSLVHVTTRIKELFEEASSYGAALLGNDKKIQESTETARLRQESRGATLVDVVNSAEELLLKTLKMIANIAGENPDNVELSANKIFSELKLTPQEQDSLLKSWISGGISKTTYLGNLKDAGIIPVDITIDEEIARIDLEKETPNLVE